MQTKTQWERKGNKPLIPGNFVPPSNTVSTWVKLFPFSLHRALQCLISSLRPCLLPGFWIRLDWHKCDWESSQLVHSWQNKKKQKGKKKIGEKNLKQPWGKKGGNTTKEFISLGKCWWLYLHFQELLLSYLINAELGVTPQDWCAHCTELFNFSLHWKIVSVVFPGGWCCSFHLWQSWVWLGRPAWGREWN